MAVDERARHELYGQVEAAMGRDSADTLMGLLPPVGWADVATKHDLDQLGFRLDARIDGFEQRMDMRFEALAIRIDAGDDRVVSAMRHEFNGLVLKMLALVIALVPALVIPLVTLT